MLSHQGPQHRFGEMPRAPAERATPLLGAVAVPYSDQFIEASAAVPPSNADAVVHSWLEGHGLEQYMQPLAEAGYTSMQFVCGMDEDDITQTIDECKMPRAHAKAFRAAVTAAREPDACWQQAQALAGGRALLDSPEPQLQAVAGRTPVVHAVLAPAPVPAAAVVATETNACPVYSKYAALVQQSGSRSGWSHGYASGITRNAYGCYWGKGNDPQGQHRPYCQLGAIILVGLPFILCCLVTGTIMWMVRSTGRRLCP